MPEKKITVVGGGLAGSEAAWQAAERGIDVLLYEARPILKNGAHVTSDLAEIVCSNSLGSNDRYSAPGLLKDELRQLGSLIVRTADRHAVPAGSALAVDREKFSDEITKKIQSHPRIRLIREEIRGVPAERPVVIATGPLTSPSLAESIGRVTESGRLFFFDAISPIVDADTIDSSVAFRASRYDKSGADYLNCPMTEEEYHRFYRALIEGEKVEPKSFEKCDYFEGCMPVEVLAERGMQTLLFGPMKPVGLTDPRSGKRPFAVVQLRQENRHGSCYNMVGFQTKLKYGEQKRIFRMIPGLHHAEFLRLGSLHRNTFIHAPSLLNPSLELKRSPGLFFGGQLTGVEGYVESAATGMLAGLNAALWLAGDPPSIPPDTTAVGSLIRYLTDPNHGPGFQPMNINFGLFPPLPEVAKEKELRKRKFVDRALEDLQRWISRSSLLKTI